MIPRANVKNLMLKRDVIQSVEKGEFHIYQVSSIEEGIEVLTGVSAGKPDKEGAYPDGTVFNAVQAKLKDYTARAYRMKKELENLY